jgi:heme-degrading monooxygenase HmoA
MVTEHALLRVRSGQAAPFEAAMASARPLIAAAPGFIDIQVTRAAEEPNLYLLLVRWDDIASHRDGFRNSENYVQWKALLHKFYDPMPDVQYFGDAL